MQAIIRVATSLYPINFKALAALFAIHKAIARFLTASEFQHARATAIKLLLVFLVFPTIAFNYFLLVVSHLNVASSDQYLVAVLCMALCGLLDWVVLKMID